jgi:hypothetical protein
MDKPEDAAYCTIARSQVKRCKEGFCEENYDLSRHCGFAFKRAVDGQTYYMNCEGGYDCSDGLCTDGSKPIITRCNKVCPTNRFIKKINPLKRDMLSI